MKNKPLFTLFLIVFIDLLGFGIILPLLPFIAEKYHANPAEIGLMVGAYSLFQFISSPILGRLSDRYGRKKLLIISQIGSAVGYLVLAFANSIPLIFLSRIIDGITGGNISIAQAYIADVTDKKDRAKGMGLIGAAFGLGFIFGPAIGGILAKHTYETPALFAAFVSLITVFTTAILLKETVDTRKAKSSPRTKFSIGEIKNILSLYPIGLLVLAFFILNTAFSTMQSNFALWTQSTFAYGPSENGYIFAFIGVLSVVIQLKVLPFLVSKTSEQKILISSALFMSLGLAALSITSHLPLLFWALTMFALGNGLSNPVIQSLASENVPKEDYGGTLGFLQSAGSLGRIVGPIAGGALFSIFGKDLPFLISGILAFVVFILLLLKLKENTS